jgi:hypothetical protein
MDPPVSEPNAAMMEPAATAAPDPPLDPPALRRRSQGLRVGGVDTPSASSCVVVLPTMTAPACRRRAVAVLSVEAGGTSENARLPHLVGIPATSNMSLIPTGIPCRGPRRRPSCSSRSRRSACVSAPSASTVTKACKWRSTARRRWSVELTSATELSSPSSMSAAAALISTGGITTPQEARVAAGRHPVGAQQGHLMPRSRGLARWTQPCRLAPGREEVVQLWRAAR